MPAYDDPVDRIHDPVDTSTTDSGRRGEAALPISIYARLVVINDRKLYTWIYATNKLWTGESRTPNLLYDFYDS